MIRRDFLKRMAFAALACGLFNVRVPDVPTVKAPIDSGWFVASTGGPHVQRMSLDVPRQGALLHLKVDGREKVLDPHGARTLEFPVLRGSSGTWEWV